MRTRKGFLRGSRCQDIIWNITIIIIMCSRLIYETAVHILSMRYLYLQPTVVPHTTSIHPRPPLPRTCMTKAIIIRTSNLPLRFPANLM